jgi:Flp pilus assembly protein TadG
MERGQSTVEFALLLPLLVMCVGLLLAVVAVTQAQLMVVNASRNAARAAVVHTGDDAQRAAQRAAQAAASASTSLRPLQVTVTTRDNFMTVSVSARWGLPLPFVSALLPTVTLRASTTMLREEIGSFP